MLGDDNMDSIRDARMFFASDLKIKEILLNLSPKEEDRLNPENYSDKLYNSLDLLEYHLETMLKVLHSGEIEYASKLIASFKFTLEKIGADYSKLETFYKICLSNLSEELVDYANKNCVGYTFSTIDLTKANSINELIHLLHSELLNSEKFYESFPSLEEKQNNKGYKINIRGQENNIAKTIFESLPEELTLGPTDIISFNDKTAFIMVRDRGHALTIKVESIGNTFIVNYFIPKICNVLMVNRLKGVTKVDNDSSYTNGVFETNDLAKDIPALIGSVPMDDDMFKEGGICYREEFDDLIERKER